MACKTTRAKIIWVASERFHGDLSNKRYDKMATGKQQEKEPINIVHQNAILVETITKEQRVQKLNTEYGVNPYMKSELHSLAIAVS